MKKPLMTSPQQWTAADRLITVILMRQAGLSYAEIGRRLHVSGGRVQQIVQGATNNRVARWCWLERMRTFNEAMNERATERATA
jgi:transcriptional regulator